MPNRLAVALSIYGPQDATFWMRLSEFEHALGVYSREVGSPIEIFKTQMPYVQVAANTLVDMALKTDRPWDYLLLIEQDMILPGYGTESPMLWLDAVRDYTEPVVGAMYWGKVDFDQRAIAGFMVDGAVERLTPDQIDGFMASPGLHEVDFVGMGATAIRRDVLAEWPKERLRWFQCRDDQHGSTGQDVLFCAAARDLGHKIYVDSRCTAGHIGPWVSTYASYMATRANLDVHPLPEQPPTAMTEAELRQLMKLARGRTVLEVGSWFGASTIWLAQSAELVYACDWHRGDAFVGVNQAGAPPETLSTFWRYLGKYGVRDKVVPLVGRSEQVLPRLKPEQFDLILIDSDHSYEAVLRDLKLTRPLLKSDGLIALHDYGREPIAGMPEFGVTRAVDEAFPASVKGITGTLVTIAPPQLVAVG